MRKRALSTMLSALILVAGCASFKDNNFLLKNLDDANKAIALTSQGIAAYNGYLVEQTAYDKAESVRQYFLVALRYDPLNAKAQQYLDKVDNFKSSLVSDKLQAANKLLAKSNRKDEENYSLMLALQTAATVDPSNAAAAKLLKENAALQASLIDSYLARSKESQAKAVAASPPGAGEPLYLDAYDSAAKALALAPANAQASKQKASIKVELLKALDKHTAAASALVAKGKFDEAKSELGRASSLNSKVGKDRSAELASATYSLYIQWAKSLEAKGLFTDADDKLDLAIAAKKSDEATAFRKRLAGKAATENQDAAFDAALPEIDKLIAKGDLLGANKRIASAGKLTKDKARLEQLAAKSAKIASSLRSLYDKGVADYRAENFKSAIEQLNVVVGIDAGFEQASDYLDKAKEKQKLLDQFSN